jgi:O-antigen ligase
VVAIAKARARDVDRPTIASWFMALYAVIAVGRLTELIPGAAALPLAKAAFLLALVVVLLERKRSAPVPLHRVPMARTAVALYLLAAASVLFSIWKSYTLQTVTDSLLTVFASYLVAIAALPNWPSIKRLLRGLVYAGAVLAATGLAEFAGGRFEVGSSYDPNDLAYVLVSVVPLAIGLGIAAAGYRRLMWFGGAALLIFVALLTQSRGGLVALLAVGTFLAWKPFPRFPVQDPGRPASRRLVRNAVIVLALAATAWSFLPDDARQRFESLFYLSTDYNVDATNETGRLALWKRGIVAAAKKPIGYGAGNFSAVDGAYGGRYKAAHNSFLLVLVELGVMGLVLFIRMYYLAWRTLNQPPAANSAAGGADPTLEMRILGHAIKGALIGTLVAGFFLSQTYASVLWLIFGAVAAISALSPSLTTSRGHAPYSFSAVSGRRLR